MPRLLLFITTIGFWAWSSLTIAATVNLNSSGAKCPIESSSGGLNIFVGDNSQFQVERCSISGAANSRQFYSNGAVPSSTAIFNSIYLRVGTAIFGASSIGGVSVTPWTAVSNTGGSVSGSGTTITVYKGTISSRTYTVTQTVTYVFPNDFYTIKLDVDVPTGNTADIKLYSWTDLQINGDDTGQCIIDSSFPNFVGGDATDRTAFAGYRQHSLGSVWNRYFCGFYNGSNNFISPSPYNLPNTAVLTNIDLGAAIQWDIGVVAGTTFTADYDFIFSVKKPSLTKYFGPADADNDNTILPSATSSLTFALTNVAGRPAQSAIGFTDTLPSGVAVVGTPVSPQCGGTVVKSTSGGQDTIKVTGASLSGGVSSCIIAANVTASVPGPYVNGTGNISSLTNLLNFANAKLTVLGVDYGDAPSGVTFDAVTRTYGSASHSKPTTPTVYLGTTAPDIDTAANQTTWQAQTSAAGDDTAGSVDEGIAQLLSGAPTAFPLLSSANSSYNLSLVCVGTGTVSGWIDFNKNGSFENTGGELAQGSCSSGAVTLTWSGFSGIKTGNTFARFRIASLASDVANATGAAADGEVEDYPLTIRPSVKIIKTLAPTTNSGKFNLTVSGGNALGGTNPVSNIGDNGTTGFVAVDAATAITVQETAGTNTDLANYISSLNCKLGDNTAVTLTSSTLTGATRSGSFIAPVSGSAGTAAQVICTFTNAMRPTVTINKISQGGVGVFSFTGTNGLPTTTTAITTIADGSSATSSALTNVPLTALNTLTTITEGTLPAGYTLTGASCSGLNGSDSATLSGLNLNIPATSIVAGATINCTFTNTKVTAVAIKGTVFKDTGTSAGIANNGIQESVETGIAGVSVKLTNCSGTIYNTTTTDGTGGYSLPTAGVAAGTVCVEESNLSGYLSTGANVAGSTTPSGYTLISTDKIRFLLATNTNYIGLNFGDAPVSQLLTDGVMTGMSGTTVMYTHTFIAGSGGTVNFSLPGAIATPVLAGWKEVLYTDTNCNSVLDSGENITVASAIPVVADAKVCLILKEFIPAGAPLGATNLVLVKADFIYTGASSTLTASYTRQDLTTVSDTAVDLKKMVRNVTTDGAGTPNWKIGNTAKAGEILEYRITYTNNGATPINALKVNDVTPAYTTFISALAGTLPPTLTTCTKKTPTAPASISCSALDTTGGTGGIEWKFEGSLAPSNSGFVTFRVRLD